MTYHELVKKVQTAMTKADASKVTEHIAVQVNVTGEAEGAFYMEIAEGVLFVAPYDYNDRDALLTADGADVLSVAQGKISLEAAIAEGKVAHEGDYAKTLTLGSVIPAKKTAGRKTKAAKAEAEAAPVEAAPAEEAPKPKRTCKKACKTAEAAPAEEAPKAKKTTAKKSKAAEAKPKRTRKAKADK